jgi:hypothetical protein
LSRIEARKEINEKQIHSQLPNDHFFSNENWDFISYWAFSLVFS